MNQNVLVKVHCVKQKEANKKEPMTNIGFRQSKRFVSTCGIFRELVTLLSIMTTDAAIIAGNIPIPLVDSAPRPCCSRDHAQKIWIHLLLINTLAGWWCWCCHLLLDIIVGYRNCSNNLHTQYMRWHFGWVLRAEDHRGEEQKERKVKG